MQTCYKNPKKLYEKFNRDVSRNTQKEEWEKVSDELTATGIDVGSMKNLGKMLPTGPVGLLYVVIDFSVHSLVIDFSSQFYIISFVGCQ